MPPWGRWPPLTAPSVRNGIGANRSARLDSNVRPLPLNVDVAGSNPVFVISWIWPNARAVIWGRMTGRGGTRRTTVESGAREG